MGKLVSALISLAALSLPGAALALAPIAMQNGKAWVHKQTKLKIPATVDGFIRREGNDYGSSQSDVMFQFADPASDTRVTLYLYRAGSANVPIWADRAENSIVINAGSYGTLNTADRRFSYFSPWNNAPNSAVRIVFPLSGKGATATGLMLAQRGDWLIKIRMTSNRLDAAAVEARLASFFTGLGFKADKRGADPAYAVQPCADRLPDSDAKLVERSKEDGVLAGALMSSIVPLAANNKPERAPTYCRDATSEELYSVYRPSGAKDRYVLAIGDGGVTIAVGRDTLGELVNQRETRFSPILSTADRAVGFAPYTALPSPRQIMRNLNALKPIWARSRLPGQEKNVQIFM
ncbi:MAG: hypothetical protein ACKOPM_08275 [Novosphingobium sp.]